MITTARNANLGDLLRILQEQHARKLDVVVPATKVRAHNGSLVVAGTDVMLTEDGVTSSDGTYVPTVVADEGIAAKLGIPVSYLRRLRDERPDLYDANVNGWLHGGTSPTDETTGTGPDPRSFLLRAFRGDAPGDAGIARAFLSDRYAINDNLDVLMAALDGVRAAGVQVQVAGGDLTDRRMVMRLHCPEVAALAPRLLDGYRSPFTGQSGTDNPVVFAGLVISNSETGGGAFNIVPQVVVQVCTNGMTMAKDAMKQVHLGGRLDEGIIRWGADTQAKALDLVKSKTRDAVATFLDADYLNGAVARLEARSSEPVASVDAVKDITKPLGYTQDAIDGILGYFVQGGQMTRGGVVNAITAYAQDPAVDGDQRHDLEMTATRLLVG